MNEEVRARLETSRKELLDLGLRNPLINHRSRAKQVKIVDELSPEIYRILVTEGRTMSFEALPENKLEKIAQSEMEEGGSAEDIEWESLLKQPDETLSDGELASRHVDSKLQTNLSSQKLQTRLLSIHNDARTYIEEQGVNILYLVLGFLHWYEAPSANEARRAPLILVPVELKRANAQERFKLTYTGSEIGDNLSLVEKLRSEFNIKLPTLEEEEELDFDAYVSSVAEAVKGDPRWKIEANEITLGFFSFGKFLMYKDLDPEPWPDERVGAGSIILDGLLGDGLREPESRFGDDTHIDEVISPAEVHQVKDADSSQILAIFDVLDGRNMVLQGPPGTGKSQTITNIIAECIGKGQKVLFVSEKMAALDVVKRRLDEVGLGDAVLELHSHKTNKRQVLEELNRTLHLGRPIVGNTQDDIDTLTRLRDELNAYSDAVNTPIGNTRTSFINALGMAIQNRPEDAETETFEFKAMEGWSDSDYRAARLNIQALDRHLAAAGPPAKNPFKVSKLTEFLPSQRARLESALARAGETTDLLRSHSHELASNMGLQPPDNRAEVEVICRAARRAMEAPHLEGVALSSDEWQKKRDDIVALIAAGKELSEAHARYDEWLIDDAWQQDFVGLRREYVTKGDKWWRFLSGDFRRAKSKLQGLTRKPLPKNTSETIAMIDTVLDSQKHQAKYNELSELGMSLFGAQWKKTKSDWEVLDTLSRWIVALYRDVGEGLVPDGILNFLSGSPKLDALNDQVSNVESLLNNHQEVVSDVSGLLQFRLRDNSADWGLTFEKQSSYLDVLGNNIDRLFDHVRYNQLAGDFRGKGLEFVLPITREWDGVEGSLLKLFDYSWYSGLVEKAYVETPSIKLFDRTHHKHILEEFTRLDHLLFRHNQARLSEMHWESLPKLNSGGELQIISREINKKRRHMPIRRLMSEAGRALQAIKPVFMMSPMSVATYLPPGSVNFDIVVFDEASQVKPVDAFGAIIRGNQAVVVGDSKQLPPTSFFDSLAGESDEEDFESVGDMESILSLFLGKGAHERMLRWHYRSRHDSLIAVSNYEFYDSKLVIFPSPGVNTQARGLKLHHLPNTAYDRGKTRTNPEEAKAVAQAVMEHARNTPDLTLGVVAFSTAQRDAIEQQLELMRREDVSCETFFSENTREPFFVKNLENVQGDERDVIYISIGYGKTKDGYMAMSFGPLNRDGGERRLNVLISRARLAMDVFSNFTADDIDQGRTNARGVIALKNFLAFARTGILEQPVSTEGTPDSPFEESVIKALQQHGIDVEPQVGTSGFFIDIAVKHPDKPGVYLLGIECDGATYHSSRSARDRDRLRQEVLEGLGWRLHRIWSTEWYRSPEQEIERVLAAIESARLDYESGVLNAVEKQNDVQKPIERVSQSLDQQEYEPVSVPYQRIMLEIPLGNRELHDLPAEQLLEYVQKAIDLESPIHLVELTRRITEGAGFKRSGSRIQTAVLNAIALGEQRGAIVRKADFLWHPEMTIPPLRDRSDLDSSSKKIENVSPEEIQLAILKTVEAGFSLSQDEAITSAANLLGFQRVTAPTKKALEAQLWQLINRGQLLDQDGRVSIPA